MSAPVSGPHQGQPLAEAGAPLSRARGAMVMVHGRGADAADMIGLAQHVLRPDMAYFAPQAAGGSWYANSFLAPLAANEPGLSSGLQAIANALARIEAAGIPRARTILLGFSQGACLSLEYAARNTLVCGGVIGLSGGLIGMGQREGAPPHDKRFDYPGEMAGTPVFLGCNEVDPHIPLARVQETGQVFRRLGAEVTERIYPGMGHGVVEDEVRFIRDLLARIMD